MRVAKPGKQLQTIKLSLYIAKIVRVAKLRSTTNNGFDSLYIAKIAMVTKHIN